jgi:hypothetical protein
MFCSPTVLARVLHHPPVPSTSYWFGTKNTKENIKRQTFLALNTQVEVHLIQSNADLALKIAIEQIHVPTG